MIAALPHLHNDSIEQEVEGEVTPSESAGIYVCFMFVTWLAGSAVTRQAMHVVKKNDKICIRNNLKYFSDFHFFDTDKKLLEASCN